MFMLIADFGCWIADFQLEIRARYRTAMDAAIRNAQSAIRNLPYSPAAARTVSPTSVGANPRRSVFSVTVRATMNCGR